MKDGRTHLAHKAEHAVDLASGAVVGVTVQGADTGDATSRGRRCWTGQPTARDAVPANRRRIRGVRGRRLLRCRGAVLERPFAHVCETGGMRRVHLRGHPNIVKRGIRRGYRLGSSRWTSIAACVGR